MELEENEHETMQSFLIAELQHRIRNVLSLVQYLVVQTHSDTVTGYRDILNARIRNLAEAYELIVESDGHLVSLAEILERTLKLMLRSYKIVFRQLDRILTWNHD